MDEVRKLLDSLNEEFQGLDRADNIPDSTLESRFNSLSLAFRTDRMTLDKRLGIQESSRDLAEKNVEKELQALRDSLQALKSLGCGDKAQEVSVRMDHHLDVLEHTIARLSTRAEVLGAVQQEKRMCLAMEVMITFTENVRRLRDKEMSQVEIARRMLHDRGSLSGRSFDSMETVTAKLRRRSELALPRMLGGGGMPTLHFSSSMQELSPSSVALNPQRDMLSGLENCHPDSTEDPKLRFQTATANVSIRNLVTSTLRHGPLERQKRVSCHSSSNSSSAVSAGDSQETRHEDIQEERTRQQAPTQEGVFKNGLDAGGRGVQKDVALDKGDKDPQRHGSAVPSKPPSQGKGPMDATARCKDTVRASQDKDSPSTASEASVTQKEDGQTWLPGPSWMLSDVTWRHIIAAVIFVFAMGVLVVTFVFSSDETALGH